MGGVTNGGGVATTRWQSHFLLKRWRGVTARTYVPYSTDRALQLTRCMRWCGLHARGCGAAQAQAVFETWVLMRAFVFYAAEPIVEADHEQLMPSFMNE